MAVVNAKSSLIGDYLAGIDNPDPEIARGRPTMAQGTVANAATDNNLSKYKLISLPSNVILLERTAFQVQNWGFATVNIGTYSAPTALGTVLKSGGNVYSPVAVFDAGNLKRLWERLGLASDPGGLIDLYAHATADATGAGTMLFRFEYLFR